MVSNKSRLPKRAGRSAIGRFLAIPPESPSRSVLKLNKGITMRWIRRLMRTSPANTRGRHGKPSLSLEYLESRELLDATNLAFVNKAYLDLLRRAADPGGLAYFTGLLDSGTASRSQVALALQTGTEFQNNEVQALYGTYLRRGADPSGLATYTGLLATGSTDEQVAAILAGSDEYFQTRG